MAGDKASRQPVLKKIAVNQIHPNPYNPNQMKKGEFQQYIAEVKHLNRLPKPIVVRPKEDGYEIVDGEHGWRAAQQVGLRQILCEVVEIDDFEARRQCYKRNRGGKDNPVRLGRMFLEMQQQRKLSIRKLAKEVEITEGTIRNYLLYAEAAELRSQHTRQPSDAEVTTMSLEIVRTYIRLPAEMRDIWLDSGGRMSDLEAFYDEDLSQIVLPLQKANMFGVLKSGILKFRSSLRYALELSSWRNDNQHLIGIDDYIHPIAELELPVGLLDRLPMVVADGPPRIALPPETWTTTLKQVAPRASDEAGLFSLVDTSIRVSLREAGIDFQSVYSPRIAEMLQFLQQAPVFIRKADYLSVEEQFWLSHVEADCPPEMIVAAQRATCKKLKTYRLRKGGKVRNDYAPEYLNIQDIFWDCLAELAREKAHTEEDALFGDHKRLLEAILKKLAGSALIGISTIDGQPAAEILAERLDVLDWPEFYFVASLILHADSLDAAGRRWLDVAAE